LWQNQILAQAGNANVTTNLDSVEPLSATHLAPRWKRDDHLQQVPRECNICVQARGKAAIYQFAAQPAESAYLSTAFSPLATSPACPRKRAPMRHHNGRWLPRM
jgi:hypothetical protein